jgi:hypothetical protein
VFLIGEMVTGGGCPESVSGALSSLCGALSSKVVSCPAVTMRLDTHLPET